MGSVIRNNKGIALITALIISTIMLIFAAGVLYFILQSTHLSSIGKAYATEREAVDGGIELVKDSVNLVLIGEPFSDLIDDPNNCFTASMSAENYNECEISFPLPATTWFQNFNVTARVQRLRGGIYIPGSRIEYAQASQGLPSRGILVRINLIARGPKNTMAEATALYRYVN